MIAHEKEQQIISVFTRAEQAYRQSLSQFTLDHVVAEICLTADPLPLFIISFSILHKVYNLHAFLSVWS